MRRGGMFAVLGQSTDGMEEEDTQIFNSKLQRWVSPSAWVAYFKGGTVVKEEEEEEEEAEKTRRGRRVGITCEEKRLRSLVLALSEHVARCEGFVMEDPGCAAETVAALAQPRRTIRISRRRVAELRKERTERQMRRKILKSLRRNAAASAERTMVMRPGERIVVRHRPLEPPVHGAQQREDAGRASPVLLGPSSAAEAAPSLPHSAPVEMAGVVAEDIELKREGV